MNAYRIKKIIGSYTAALNGLDAIVFTAGIGENSSYMRKLVCTDMDYFGIEIRLMKRIKFVLKMLGKSTDQIQKLKFW